MSQSAALDARHGPRGSMISDPMSRRLPNKQLCHPFKRHLEPLYSQRTSKGRKVTRIGVHRTGLGIREAIRIEMLASLEPYLPLARVTMDRRPLENSSLANSLHNSSDRLALDYNHEPQVQNPSEGATRVDASEATQFSWPSIDNVGSFSESIVMAG